MAKPLGCRSSCRNPLLTGKDEPADPFPNECSDIYTPAQAVLRTPTPPLAFAPVNADGTVRYSEADLKRIIWTILVTKLPAPTSQSLVFLDGPCKRPLKAKFLELYCGKTHIECYNFIQQYEVHFATAKAKRPNHIPFVAIFFQKQALFCCQQYKAKNVAETNVPLTWEEFKAFLC